MIENSWQQKFCILTVSLFRMSCEAVTIADHTRFSKSRQICMCVQVRFFSPVCAHWSIVIGLSVSGLHPSFVPWAFCSRATLGQRRKAWGGWGADRKWRMFASRRAWLIPSTKSPDIYSALLANLKKNLKKKIKIQCPFLFLVLHIWEILLVCNCFYAGFYCRMIFKRRDENDNLSRWIKRSLHSSSLVYIHKYALRVSFRPSPSPSSFFYTFHKSDVCWVGSASSSGISREALGINSKVY